MAAGASARPSAIELHQLARAWFAEIREEQRTAVARRPDAKRQDAAADDLSGGLLDWLIADTAGDDAGCGGDD